VIGKHFRRRHHGTLFRRVYLYSAALLFVAGAAAGITVWLLGGQPMWKHGTERAANYLARDLGGVLDRPAELQRRLDLAHEELHVRAAVYDAGGQTLAKTPDAPEALERSPGERSLSWGRGHMRIALPLGKPGIYLRAAIPRAEPQHARHITVVLAVLLALALAARPFARAIARPLEKLTIAAKSLGQGNLSARSGLAPRHDEVGDLARAFDDMADRIQRLVRAEKTLLANVSHELRTPMSRIRVALELAEESGDTEGLRRHLGGIGEDLAELERLVQDVLATARMDGAGDGGPIPLRRQEVAVADLLAASARRFEARHAEHTLQVEAGAEMGTIDADPVLMRRVLDNLLDNAARYADPEAGPVEMVASRDDQAVTMEVRDRGIGVAEEDLERIFTPFFRTDASRDRASGGLGLGLALCRRIVEAHGGQIRARRREGGGLVVCLKP